MSIGLIVALMNLFCGVGLAYFAYSAYSMNQRKLAKWAKKKGVVVAFRNSRGSVGEESMSTLHPVIEYQANDGSKLSFESRVGSSNWKFGVGSEVDILVNPSNPKNAELLGAGVQDFMPIVLAAISVSMIFSAPVIFIFF